jgi:hypothetical protein
LITYNPDVIMTIRAGNTDGWVLWSNAYGFKKTDVWYQLSIISRMSHQSLFKSVRMIL